MLIITQLTDFETCQPAVLRWSEETHPESCKNGKIEQGHVRLHYLSRKYFSLVQNNKIATVQMKSTVWFLNSAATFENVEWFTEKLNLKNQPHSQSSKETISFRGHSLSIIKYVARKQQKTTFGDIENSKKAPENKFLVQDKQKKSSKKNICLQVVKNKLNERNIKTCGIS